jgi:uncharacterized protein (TIGR03067 family)
MLSVRERLNIHFWKSSTALKVLFLLAIGVLFGGNEAYRYLALRSDLQQLQGEWILESREVDGEKIPSSQLASYRRVVDAEGYTVHYADNTGPHSFSAKWTLDPTREPKAVDIVFSFGGSATGSPPNRGIYRIDGDRHMLCLAARSDQERPTTFDSSGNAILVVWKRK